MKQPESIFYVCCGKKCKKRGSKLILSQLKSEVKDRGLKKRIQVIRTGCTDHCKHGPIVTIMPQNEWVTEVDGDKVREIFARVVSNQKS